MRQTKSAELKREIEILSQTFERIMDRKDAVIQQFAKDLEESEEQNRIATRAHQRNLQKLIEVRIKLLPLKIYLRSRLTTTFAGGLCESHRP